MKLIPYRDLLKAGKEGVQELLAAPRSLEMRKKAELEVSKLDVRMAEKENEIQEIASEYPIDFNKLIAAQDDLALSKRRKKQLETIVEEMFP